MITEREILGIRIKNLRKKKKMTQEMLCELAGMDLSTLNRIEKGRRFPSLEKFISILKVLQTKPDELLDFIDFNSAESSNLKNLMLYELIENLDEKTKDKLFVLIDAIK